MNSRERRAQAAEDRTAQQIAHIFGLEAEPAALAFDPYVPPVEALAVIEPAETQLMHVLPGDFPLPSLIKFCPNPALKEQADEAARYALSLDVVEAEGLQKADLALTVLRARQQAISEDFKEPTELAHQLHKRLTSLRAEWLEPGETALKTVGKRIYTESQRLEQLEAESRRKAQEEADRKARDDAKREAEAAAKANAPAQVVEELQRQAETATAPPVSWGTSSVLKGNATVKKWKARLAGTPGDAEPNPAIEDLTPQQRMAVFTLLKAILDGKAPIAAIEVNWAYANRRAVSDKKTFAIPGLEAFEDGGVRGKSGRRSS